MNGYSTFTKPESYNKQMQRPHALVGFMSEFSPYPPGRTNRDSTRDCAFQGNSFYGGIFNNAACPEGPQWQTLVL